MPPPNCAPRRQHEPRHEGGESGMRDQAHFGFAGGARSEIKDGGIFSAHLGTDFLERSRVLIQSLAAFGSQLIERQRALGFAGQQDEVLDWS